MENVFKSQTWSGVYLCRVSWYVWQCGKWATTLEEDSLDFQCLTWSIVLVNVQIWKHKKMKQLQWRKFECIWQWCASLTTGSFTCTCNLPCAQYVQRVMCSVAFVCVCMCVCVCVCVCVFVCLKTSVYTFTSQVSSQKECILLAYSLYMLPEMFAKSIESYRKRYSPSFYSRDGFT